MSTSSTHLHTRSLQMADVPPPNGFSFAEAVGTAAALATAAAVGFLKFWERLKSTQKTSVSTDGEIEVINSLRSELARLSEQNGKLANSLNELQTEVVMLRSENAQLHSTVARLNEEIALLRASRQA